MSGTAILTARTESRRLQVVTVTINNVCNLTCGHCYLQYQAEIGSSVIEPDTLDWIFDSPFDHFAIVGKEPLANSVSANLCAEIAIRANNLGRTCSLITNGVHLDLLPATSLSHFKWLDISMDRGLETPSKFRDVSLDKVIDQVANLRKKSSTPIRILNTITSFNGGNIDDMLCLSQMLDAEVTLFSPFQETLSDGMQTETMINPIQLRECVFASSLPELASAYLAIDTSYLRWFQLDVIEFINSLSIPLGDRLIFTDKDPITHGLIRVTFDGLVLRPFDSIHTQTYSRDHIPPHTSSLAKEFRRMLNEYERA